MYHMGDRCYAQGTVIDLELMPDHSKIRCAKLA